MRRRILTLAFALIAGSVMVMPASALADTTTLSTSDNQFDAGTDNQGWWSTTDPSTNVNDNDDLNDNYVVGSFGGEDHRAFFTFDLSGLAGCTVNSATLQLSHKVSAGAGPHQLGIFDVSTDASTLNHNSGTSAAIYDDLGTGTQYASVSVPTAATGIESIPLNLAAVSDMNAGVGRFFSVGGSITNLPASGSNYLFGASDDRSNELVVDFSCNEPPVCTNAAPSLDVIWPPNHKFVDTNVEGVSDPDGDGVTINIDSIFQDEETDALGDGAFTPDGVIDGATAAVRAERSGTGNGRVYTIAYTADDGNGGTCTGTVKVGVPRHKKDTPVDEGALFDSTI